MRKICLCDGEFVLDIFVLSFEGMLQICPIPKLKTVCIPHELVRLSLANKAHDQ